MEIVSLCPLRVAARPFFQINRPSPALLVVCKATYRLVPGTSRLAEKQEDLHEDDNHWDDNTQRSLYAASDFVPWKRGADVVLVGHAFSPGAKPVRSFLTRLCVGEVDKAIEVFADRLYTPHGDLRDGPRVNRVRLRYERAAGGLGTTNPVGMRPDAKDSFGAIALPNLQPAGKHVTRPEDLMEPIAYGPIPPMWPTRLSRLGSLATHPPSSRWYEAQLPDIDPAFWNCAPLDQEVRELRPDERIVLEGLHPDHARLATNLPGMFPRAVVERASGAREEISLVADTLWIDTTRAICTLVWRGRIALSQVNEMGRVVVTMSDPGWMEAEPPTMERAQLHSIPISHSDPDGSITMTIDARLDKPAHVMPFAQGPAVPPPRESGVFPSDPDFADDDAITFVGDDIPAPVLPFRAPATPPSALPFAPPPVPPPVASPLPQAAAADLPFVTPWSRPSPMPFRAPAQPPPVPPPFAQPPPIPPPFAQPSPPPVQPPPFAQPSPPPPVAPPPPIPAPPPVPGPGVPLVRLGAPLSQASPMPAMVAKVTPSPAPSEPTEPAEAPPMIGPLATPEMVATKAPPPPPPVDAKVEEAPPPEPTPAPPQELPLEAYPIERCARITASIARRREQRPEILEEEELDLARWGDLEKHWADAITAEAERGKTKLLKAFDTAYVARLEEERGPIMSAEYARLVVAGERGHAPRTLAELGLPRGAMLRIERVFLARMAEDPALAEKIRRAIDVERDA